MPEKEKSKLAEKYEKAVEAKKFSEEDIEKIKDIQKQYVGIQQAFGQLELNKFRLKTQEDNLGKMHEELKNKLFELQESESNLIKEFNEKYGEGTLDLESGNFVENKSE